MKRRIGFFCMPGRGHLYPGMALCRRLKSKGFDITVFGRPITRAIVGASGLSFRPLVDPRPRTTAGSPQSARFMGAHPIDTLHAHAMLILRTASSVMESDNFDAFLVDQGDLAAGSIADYLGIPFINISMFPPVYLNNDVPPFIYPWVPSTWRDDQERNRRGNNLIRRLLAPTLHAVNTYRESCGLALATDINDLFSRLAIISQLPEELDFPRTMNTPPLFHAGNFYDDNTRPAVKFPWSRLNGKPVVYASMGTVRTESHKVFEMIAAACAAFDVQLVLSLGGMSLTPEAMGNLPGDPIVVHFAPQMEILKRSVLCITHAGMNTVLEAVACGVPLVAVPVTDDQPGIAARIEWKHIGLSVPFRHLSIDKLRDAIGMVLRDTSYRTAVRRLQTCVRGADGLEKATDIIESALG
jgi:zeaxanthin glucosyltransferase